MARRWRESDDVDLPTPYGPPAARSTRPRADETSAVVSLADVVAALLFVGVVAYALFGGADFGSGVWDLLAGGDEAGGALRAQIDHSIGPVWEANHVWLIYVLVFLWTAFPDGLRADDDDAVRAVAARRARHRAARRGVRVPQVLGDARRGAAVRRRCSPARR